MVESVMRQGMKSWLKTECVNTGIGLMHLSAYVADIQYSMFHYNQDGVKHAAQGFNNQLLRLVEPGYLTPEDATLYKDRVNLAVGKFIGGKLNEVSEAIKDMIELTNRLDIITLERTVECQSGKST